jgi:hypothetical protein
MVRPCKHSKLAAYVVAIKVLTMNSSSTAVGLIPSQPESRHVVVWLNVFDEAMT